MSHTLQRNGIERRRKIRGCLKAILWPLRERLQDGALQGLGDWLRRKT
jgi:hypothetical protein